MITTKGINKHNLDVEWVDWDKEYGVILEDWVVCSDARETARRVLTEEEDRVDLLVRSNPGDFALDKISEKSVLATVGRTEEVLKLKAELITTISDLNSAVAKKMRMEGKSKALEYLSKLFMGGFYSDIGMSDSDKSSLNRVKENRSKKVIKHKK